MHAPQRLDLATISRLTELADYIVPLTLGVVAELGVADHLTAGPCSIERLAELTHTDERSLLLAMRCLASKGVFQEPRPDVFDLAPVGQYLRSDHPYSLREGVTLQSAEIAAWSRVEHTMRTGEPAFQLVHRQPLWEYMGANANDGQRFDASQEAMTRLEVPFVNRLYRWDLVRTVVDLGGGSGALLGGLLARRSELRGTLFDLPHVIEGARARLSNAEGVADRCTLIGGSYLDGPLPAGADVYMMKRVLWGHADDEATKLLRNVRAAMRPDSALLIIEPVRSERPEAQIAKVMDLKLLVMGGGGSRNTSQLERLFAAANLRLEQVTSAVVTSIVQVRPVVS